MVDYAEHFSFFAHGKL